jgi:hypothetical protein
MPMRPRYPLLYNMFWVGVPVLLLLVAVHTHAHVLLVASLVLLVRLVAAGLNSLIPQPFWLGGVRIQATPEADFWRGCLVLGVLLLDAALFALLILHSET